MKKQFAATLAVALCMTSADAGPLDWLSGIAGDPEPQISHFGTRYEMIEAVYECYGRRLARSVSDHTDPRPSMTMGERTLTYVELSNKGFSEEEIFARLKNFRVGDRTEEMADLPQDIPPQMLEIARTGSIEAGHHNSRTVVEKAAGHLWESVVIDGEDYRQRIWVEQSSLLEAETSEEKFQSFLIGHILFCAKFYFDNRSEDR